MPSATASSALKTLPPGFRPDGDLAAAGVLLSTMLCSSRFLPPVRRKLRGLPQHRVDPALPAAAAAAEVCQHVRIKAETDRVFGISRFRPAARTMRKRLAAPVPDATAKILIGQFRD